MVGVVDEALDWGHHEFLKEGILHPDSVLTYSGNREPTPLEKFHGTATSSIIAGRKDDIDIPKNKQFAKNMCGLNEADRDMFKNNVVFYFGQINLGVRYV